jgi:hypothetical protein
MPRTRIPSKQKKERYFPFTNVMTALTATLRVTGRRHFYAISPTSFRYLTQLIKSKSYNPHIITIRYSRMATPLRHYLPDSLISDSSTPFPRSCNGLTDITRNGKYAHAGCRSP